MLPQPFLFNLDGDPALQDAQRGGSLLIAVRESYSRAKRRRATACSKATVSGRPASRERALVLSNCRVLDVDTGNVTPPQDVLVMRGRIAYIGTSCPLVVGEQPVVMIDCQGKILMPGLCDAHVHCTAVTANLSTLMSLPESYVAARAADILEGMLSRGFTTIRDAGGADFGLAQAVEEGVILGPRLLFTGHALSQTGGHGDMRGKGEDCCACGAALRGIGRVCDGDTEVRRAARDELRKGAHCIKVMASGGVASPTDRLTNSQFSLAELTAIVQEATACSTYVCAHAYTPPAIQRAVECGVRSIEHGNYMDEATADMMAQHGTYLVPTLVTYQKLADSGEAAGMPKELVAKVGDCVAKGLEAVQLAHAKGITMCYGSDLLGDLHQFQSLEFHIRSHVLPASELVQHATVNCAHLFKMQDRIGLVKEGLEADLLLVDSNPCEDIGVLAEPEHHMVLVIKEGLVARAPRGRGFEEINDKIVFG